MSAGLRGHSAVPMPSSAGLAGKRPAFSRAAALPARGASSKTAPQMALRRAARPPAQKRANARPQWI
eukprot:8574287-Pyramimonas_sp.AAC.2